MTREELETLTHEEVCSIADKLNIKPHPRAKTETIIGKILQQPKAYLSDAMKHKAERQVDPLVVHTEAQILEAIKPYASKDGFNVTFPGDNTWCFEYKGAMDTGHMSAGLRIIAMKAQTVAYGRRVLRGMDGFDKITNVARNAYTNTVLA